MNRTPPQAIVPYLRTKIRRNLVSLFPAIALLSQPLLAEDLLQVTHYALEQDQQLRISRLGVDIRQQQLQQTESLLLPSLSGSARYTQSYDTRYSGDNHNESYSISLTQKLYHRDSSKRIEQSSVRSEESQLALEEVQQQLLLRTATAYFDQLSTEDALQLAQQEKHAVAEQLKQSRQQFNVGATSKTDLQEVQARFDLVHAQWISARAAVENSREALYEIVHHELTTLHRLNPSTPLPASESDSQQQWVDRALNNSLALQQLQKQLESAKLGTEVERSADYPTLNLVGALSHSNNRNSNYGADSDSYSLGLQATLPLYNGGNTRARVSEALLLQQQAAASLEQQQRSTIKTIRSNVLAVNTASELIKAQQQVLSSAQTAFNATETGVAVGTRTMADLLDAQKELYSARRDLAQARYDLLLTRLTLKQSAGVLMLEDMEAISQLLQP